MKDERGYVGAIYEDLAVRWDVALVDAKRANPLFDALHEEGVRLKQTADGRRSLEELTAHSNRAVRLNAATACLEWNAALARPVLEALVDPREAHSLAAEMVLREFHAGRLKFDW